MHLVRSVPRLEEILSEWSDTIGGDLAGYRGHCYRVLNFCSAFTPNPLPFFPEKIAIAAAFHDLGIWTHRTFDYLEPSAHLAAAYLTRCGRDDWIEEVLLMIREHHRIRPLRGAENSAAEAFRRADWIDVSGGVLTLGLPRRLIHEAGEIWPSSGFHRKLIRLSWNRFKEHPLSPLPMLKL